MKCPKCGSGQGDLYIPIDQGRLTGDAYQYCDECGYDKKIPTQELLRIFRECGYEEKVGEKP